MTTVREAAPCVFRRRGAALEEAILEAAYAELVEVGYTAFSVENVAARARTGKASIYRRWPTKPELVLDAMDAGLPTIAQCGLPLELDDSITTREALLGVAQTINGLLNSPAGDAVRFVKCEAAADPVLAELVDARFQAPRRAALLELLKRGVDRGEVRPEAVCDGVADVLPAVLMHRILFQRAEVRDVDVRVIVEQILMPLIEAR